VATADAYFTWPDGRLRYECRGCSACCKGHGIGIDVVAGQLVGTRPELAAFVRRRGDAITAFNPRDRCWFLADDGLCRVEVEDGRAAKPASCRLFPFNRVFHIGATMVVDYNSVICPLAAVGEGGVTHAEVLAEIATIQDPAIVGTSLPTDEALVARERTIAAAKMPRPFEDGATPGREYTLTRLSPQLGEFFRGGLAKLLTRMTLNRANAARH